MSPSTPVGPGPPAPESRSRRAANPWWIPPFLGGVPDSARPQLSMLGSVALALLFENYDQSMLTAALKQIAESFSVPESDLARIPALAHMGALPAFLLIPFADRIGRRRLFLVSILGISVGTVLSGFAQSVFQFAACQMIARAFMVTCSATAFVIVTEEFPAQHRGWAIGILGAIAAFGHGLGFLLFAGIEILPFGWRALYVMGMVPLLLMPRFRRQVPETGRFARHQQESSEGDSGPGHWGGWLQPLGQLLQRYPGRAFGIGVAGALSAASHATAFNLASFHVQSVHGWPPWLYSAMAISAGLVGIIGSPWAGRLADRQGRRSVGVLMLGGFPFLAFGFYQGPGSFLALFWIVMIFTLTGGNTILRALSTELFPTSYRGTSAGWLQLGEALGRVGGLFLVDWGTPDGESSLPMISLVIFFCLGAALAVFFLPETGRRELEEISQVG